MEVKFSTDWDFSYKFSCNREMQHISLGEGIKKALNGRDRATVAEVEKALSSLSWKAWGYSHLYHVGTWGVITGLCLAGGPALLLLGMSAPYIAVAVSVASLGLSVLAFVFRNGNALAKISRDYHWLSLEAQEMIDKKLSQLPSSQEVKLRYP